MSTLRVSLALATISALLAAATSQPVNAQIVTGAENGRHPTLFIEPDTFRPDFQFFAPADVTDYDQPAPRGNHGFYFEYERLYVNVSRSDAVASSFEGDFTWGNRLSMGFITEDDAGWGIVGWHIDGPNEERVYTGEEGDLPVRFDGSPLERVDTLNSARYSSVEINRYMERMYFHNGGILEPFVGLRYSKFDDRIRRTGDYLVFDLDGSLDGIADTDVLQRGYGTVENNMLGGQLGARIFKEVGHWKFNTELRAFAMQNWQFADARVFSSSTTTTGTLVLTNPSYTSFDDNAFVWGGELKMDAKYRVTRDLDFTFGFTLVDLGKGIGRGNFQSFTLGPNFENPTPNFAIQQQDVFMGAFTFGINVNR